MGNSWALFLSGGQLSPVGSCPRTGWAHQWIKDVGPKFSLNKGWLLLFFFWGGEGSCHTYMCCYICLNL